MDRVDGKVVVVTGAASGIGSAIAAAVASGRVGVWDLDEGRAKEGAARLADDAVGGWSTAPTRPSVDAAMQSTIDTLGPVDVLVNNAGID